MPLAVASDCLLLDLLFYLQDPCASAVVDVGRGKIAQALVVSTGVVVVDGGADLPFIRGVCGRGLPGAYGCRSSSPWLFPAESINIERLHQFGHALAPQFDPTGAKRDFGIRHPASERTNIIAMRFAIGIPCSLTRHE